jgi:hypothetical protein
MNIVFFSESQIRGKVPRDFINSRTEFGWSIALDAEWCPLNESPTGMEAPRSVSELYDLGIVIIPKNNPNIDLSKYKLFCKNVAVMQEGPHWYFQDYTIENQFNYYSTLLEADWVYCHNESDVKYYKGLGCKDVRVMRSLMIPEGLTSRTEKGKKHEWENTTIIGGNFVSWYGGFDSYIVAREIGDKIVSPSMGRKQQQEDLIEDIEYLPYMNWREWIQNLGRYNIGVHLMRTHAAGTFAMNCSFHGLPCIGYKGLDTQEILHPLTTVEVGDLEGAKELGKRLKNDLSFYTECARITTQKFKEYYTEEAWLKHWEKENK